ncbi:MAG: TRAP transporter small permease [Betaproteobacteria bacterium]|nr:TRAP transporter small permease [Betaproteobacteria bacterium]
MAKILKFCEIVAVLLLASAVLLMTAVALSRYTVGLTPVWTEPVLAILVLASVCFAMAPGLSEGAHVSIHFARGRLSERSRRLLEKAIWVLGVALGGVLTASGLRYAWDQFSIGLADYAGIPQWIPSSLATLFGVVLTLFSLAALLGKAGRR